MKKIVFISLLTVCCHTAFGQPDPGDDPDVPIDGGASILVGLGIAYGAKKIYDKKEKRNEA